MKFNAEKVNFMKKKVSFKNLHNYGRTISDLAGLEDHCGYAVEVLESDDSGGSTGILVYVPGVTLDRVFGADFTSKAKS